MLGDFYTEAGKLIIKYVAAVTHSSSNVDLFTEKLVKSNPVFEAFGNASETLWDAFELIFVSFVASWGTGPGWETIQICNLSLHVC